MKKIAALALSLFLTYSIVLADTPKDADAQPAKPAQPAKAKAVKKADKSDSAIAAEIEELRQTLQAQQEQLSLLKEELAKRDRQIDEARDTAASANARAAEANTKATEAVNTTAEVKSSAATLSTTVSDLKVSNEALKTTVATAQAEAKKAEEAPTAIHIKGITITPGGFFAAESVWRQRALSADDNTPFTTVPFSGAGMSKVSEFNASGRPTRITTLVEGKIDHAKFTGYYEADFLSAAVTSNNRQSNSYALRQRQVWGQAALDGGWTFTGGQMWSLVTETKKGLQNRTEATPMVIDHQYNVGFGWARQYGFRITKSFNDKFTLGFSVENAQTTFGGRGVPAGTFFINAPGASGGLYNAFDPTGYTTNRTPDFIFKAAFEPGWGHYELFGLISTFRARVYPCGAGITVATPCSIDGSTASSSVGAFNDSRTGGGIGANLRAPVFGKYGDFGIHVMGGDGIGRYGSAQLSDVTARPNGTLAPIRGGNALGTLEFHPNPKLDVYFNYGIEYAYRTWYDTSTTVGGVTTIRSVGYGSPFNNNSGCSTEVIPGNQNTPGAVPGTCTGDIRNIQEGSVGFWHRFYKGPKGTLQWGIQYSYVVKNTWSGNNNTPTAVGLQPKAIDNMVFTSFRYYIP
jgi:hypothetical protein